MMKKYKVYAVMSYILKTEVEAENEDQAWQIAHDTDGGMFTMVKDSGDWHIDEVKEIA
jgi:hypothetical protein